MSQNLVEEFRTRLDEPLIIAITSEYDLTNPQSLKEVRNILVELAAGSISNEVSEPPANGLTADANGYADDNSTEPTSSYMALNPELSGTEQSLGGCCSQGEDVGGDFAPTSPQIGAQRRATDDSKIAELVSMFPGLGLDKIQGALDRSIGDVSGAMDELLALPYVEPPEQRKPAIEAFFRLSDDDASGSPTKNKRKKKGKGGHRARILAMKEGALSERAVNEIMFISERLDIPYDMAMETYRDNDCSQAIAIIAILDEYIDQGVEAQGEAELSQLRDLKLVYKHVPGQYLSATIQVAGSIDGWLDEVATKLNKFFAEKARGPLQIHYSLTPIKDDVEDGSSPATPIKGMKSTLPLHFPPTGQAWGSSNRAALAKEAADFEAATASAHASTVQAIKRGRSNPLYLAAASVYADRTREMSQKARSTRTRLAFQTVNERRTADSIDLHGVTVNDGVQIALSAVGLWYNGLGEYKAREAKKGFTIITGKGRHSQGGISLMRRAMYPALDSAGWKVRDEGGKYIVEGRK